jgi:hypothetical protein
VPGLGQGFLLCAEYVPLYMVSYIIDAVDKWKKREKKKKKEKRKEQR